LPGLPNSLPSNGFPLAAAFAAVNGDVIDVVSSELSADPSLSPLLPLIQAVLSNPSITPQGANPVITIDDNENPPNAENGKGNLLSFLSFYELGYKGVVGDRFSFGVDVYHYRRKGGASFQLISSLAVTPGLGGNLGQAVRANIEPALVQGLINQGLDATTAGATAQAIGANLEEAYSAAGNLLSQNPLGVIPTVENTGNGKPRITLGYLSNADALSEDWEAEFNFKFFLTDKLTTPGNYTWFRLDPENPNGRSFPNNKVRFGIDYDTKSVFYGTINYQWDQSFTSNNTTFPGLLMKNLC